MTASARQRHPLGAERTAALFAVAETYLAGAGPCHDLDHVRRVYDLALYLGEETGADLAVVAAAAILHDIGRQEEETSRGRVCHAEAGARLARPILLAHGLAEETATAACQAIGSHRYRNGGTPPRTLEAKVLFDADKLDGIGAVGVGRAFLFAGQIGARLHNRPEEALQAPAYSREDTAYREFAVKLRHVHRRLFTAPGRALAADRHRFMTAFFQRLAAEVNGEWRPPRRDEGPAAAGGDL